MSWRWAGSCSGSRASQRRAASTASSQCVLADLGRGQALQGPRELAPQPFGLEVLPVVEAGAVAQAEPGQEVAPVERGRRGQRGDTGRAGVLGRVAVVAAAGQQPLELGHVQPRSWSGRTRRSSGRRPATPARPPCSGSTGCAAAPPGRARCRSRATAARPRRRGRAALGAWPGRRAGRWPCGCRPRSAPRPAPPAAARAARSAAPPCTPLPLAALRGQHGTTGPGP